MEVPRRALVTGANGFVGQVMVPALAASGYDVIATGRRPLEGVRRRGRWKHMSAVQRYTKSWLITRARAKIQEFSPALLEEGAKVVEEPRKLLAQAIRDGPGRRTGGDATPLHLVVR